MPIIAPIPRNERRQMQKMAKKTRDKDYAKRLTAMLMLHEGIPRIQSGKPRCSGIMKSYFVKGEKWIKKAPTIIIAGAFAFTEK